MPYVSWNGQEMEDTEWDNMKKEAKDRMVSQSGADYTLEIEMKGDTVMLLWKDVNTLEEQSYSAVFYTEEEAIVAHRMAVQFCKELSRDAERVRIRVLVENLNCFVVLERFRLPILMLSAEFYIAPSAYSAGKILQKLYELAKGFDLHVTNLADILGENTDG